MTMTDVAESPHALKRTSWSDLCIPLPSPHHHRGDLSATAASPHAQPDRAVWHPVEQTINGTLTPSQQHLVSIEKHNHRRSTRDVTDSTLPTAKDHS